MKVKKNEWQKHEVGAYGNFRMMKALKIVKQCNEYSSYCGIEYEYENGKREVLYSHKSEIDFKSFE